MPSPAVSPPVLSSPQLNRRIFPIIFFTFICYLTIGIPLAIIPGFTHNTLGYNQVIAGFAISIQYAATLLSRPYAGRYADLLGPKKGVLLGLGCCSLSGVFCLLASGSESLPWASLGLLFAGRLILGTLGFGVIVSFITLYYAEYAWDGAAFALTLMSGAFVGVRLVLGNAIYKYGGLNVALASFTAEALGLLLIWAAPGPVLAGLGALLTGAGFSLVFPALGVEAVKQVAPQNQGTALGTFSAFLDLGLSLAGPAAGLVMSHLGMSSIYLCAAAMAALAAVLMLRLKARVSPGQPG